MLMCCEASRNNSCSFNVHMDYMCAMMQENEQKLTSSLEELASRGLVQLLNTCSRSVQEPLNTCSRVSDESTLVANRTEQNLTEQDLTEQNRREIHAHFVRTKFDFQALYFKYPRMIGKSRGLAKCSSQIKTELDYKLLEQAISNYKTHCIKENIDPKFIKHFSTFMSEWRDWCDPKTGATSLQTKPANGIEVSNPWAKDLVDHVSQDLIPDDSEVT